MTMINRARKLVFLAEPHTASRAVKAALEGKDGWEYNQPHHSTLEELSKYGVTSEFTTLVVVRNPLDVLVTKWRHSSQQHHEFKSYFEAYKGKRQVEMPLGGFWPHADLFLYYEYLNEDWRWFFPENVPALYYDNIHRTRDKRPWQEYYKDIPQWVDYLLDKYKEFLERFGYEIDPKTLQCTVNVEKRFSNRGRRTQ